MSKIRWLHVIFIAAALACGGGAGNGNGSAADAGAAGAGGVDCDLTGQWSVTFRAGPGDCVDEGTETVDTVSITADSITTEDGTFEARIDEQMCEILATIESEEAETPEKYGLSSSTRLILGFDGDSAAGVAEMTADILEGGEAIGSCIQDYTVEASR